MSRFSKAGLILLAVVVVTFLITPLSARSQPSERNESPATSPPSRTLLTSVQVQLFTNQESSDAATLLLPDNAMIVALLASCTSPTQSLILNLVAHAVLPAMFSFAPTVGTPILAGTQQYTYNLPPIFTSPTTTSPAWPTAGPLRIDLRLPVGREIDLSAVSASTPVQPCLVTIILGYPFEFGAPPG